MTSIVIVGAYPPPVGGTSIHIQRLHELLKGSHRYNPIVIDPYQPPSVDITSNPISNVHKTGPLGIISLLKVVIKIKVMQPDIIHFHVSAMTKFIFAGPIFLLFKPSNSKTVITIHAGSLIDELQERNIFIRLLAKYLMLNFDKIIAVNKSLTKFLIKLGCNSEDVYTVPAFLPPTIASTFELSSAVTNIHNIKKRIIISSGYCIPLYGLDIIANAFAKSDYIRENYYLVLCLYHTYNEWYLKKLNQILSKVPDSLIMKDLDSEHFNFMLKNSSIYVRATDTDGDAVAIREANYYGLSVVASRLSSICRP